MLRLIAEHADAWNVPGPPHNTFDFLAERSRHLDAELARIGRDPDEITRSLQLIVQYDDPAASRSVVRRSIDLGFNHIVLALPRPYPDHAARWLRDEIVRPVLESVGVTPSTPEHVNL
jgi:alkanesulfonate monooxygenase SsuD/methylene tetrahydromethanopterin reductase-like flavin-dependent oxidoreductase (luciferase family)